MVFQTYSRNLGIFIETVVLIIFLIGLMFKYCYAYNNIQKLKVLVDQIARDWEKFKNFEERDILSNFTETGRLLTIVYVAYLLLAYVTNAISPFVPPLMDYFLPLSDGEKRPKFTSVYANYVMFEQEDYHYLTCYHSIIVHLTPVCLFTGSDSLYVLSVQHTCALFAIVCHRLNNLNNFKDKGDRMTIEVKNLLFKHSLRQIATLHNQTLRCCNYLEDIFNVNFFVLNIMTVAALALGFFYIFFVLENMLRSIRLGIFLVGITIRLFFLNWIGQKIINSSETVFYAAYFSKWYDTSVENQMLVKFIMVRSNKTYELTAGKIATLSLSTFGALMKTVASYITVFLSMV